MLHKQTDVDHMFSGSPFMCVLHKTSSRRHIGSPTSGRSQHSDHCRAMTCVRAYVWVCVRVSHPLLFNPWPLSLVLSVCSASRSFGVFMGPLWAVGRKEGRMNEKNSRSELKPALFSSPGPWRRYHRAGSWQATPQGQGRRKGLLRSPGGRVTAPHCVTAEDRHVGWLRKIEQHTEMLLQPWVEF